MRLNPQETVDLVTFAEEIPNGKLHFLCSGGTMNEYLESLEITTELAVYTEEQMGEFSTFFDF